MSEVNDQLLRVMNFLSERQALSPEGEAMQIRLGLLGDFPDHNAVFLKLEREHKVLVVEQAPDSRGLSDADHGMFESEQPKNYDRYMSYYIRLLPGYDELHKQYYLKKRFGFASLTNNTRYTVQLALDALSDALSLSGKPSLTIDPYEGIDFRALDFLVEFGAIKSYDVSYLDQWSEDFEREMPTDQIGHISIMLDPVLFDKALDEVNLSQSDVASENSARTALPIEYDDEHGKATYRGKTVELLDPKTIMGVLTDRVLLADGARINAEDIILVIEDKRIAPDVDKSTKTLTNAKDRINQKFRDAFEVEDVICYARQQFWLNARYCSVQSPYYSASSGN